MLVRPRLKHSYRPIILEPGALFLLGERAEHVFDGPAHAALAPLLDGRHTIGEILAAAAHKAPWPTLYVALSQLEAKGCLVEGPPRGSAVFWDYLGVEAEGAEAACAGTPISVRAVGALSEEPLRAALLASGLHLSDAGEISVVASPDCLLPDLRAINEQALASGRPWLLVKPVGTLIWVGPLFRPGTTGCWECLAARVRVNRQVDHFVARRTGREEPAHVARGRLESSERLAAAMAATEVARALVGAPEESLQGRLMTLDLVRRELAFHTLVKRPQCPTCGTGRTGHPAGPLPIVLETRARPAAEVADREAAAADIYDRYKHHVSPITGIVTWLIAQDSPGEGLTHNYSAGHYFPVTSDDLQALQQNIVSRSGGKGRTAIQARTGALCEALERYSGIFWGDEPRRVASYEGLGADAVHIRELALFSEAQYASRGATPALRDHHDVPPPLDEGVPISWTPVWSLTRGRTRYLPTGYCYYGFHDPGAFFTRCDSNGCAAGGTLEEAILYGFLELVERDGVALWWYNRVRRPALDAASFALPYWDEMQRYYGDELGRDLQALDLTTDIGIPVFAVVSRRRERAVEDVITGFAADLDPRAALQRALQEANQYLPSLRQEAPDGSTRYRLYDEETIRWWKTATYANQPYLVPEPTVAPRKCADFQRLATGDLKRDVEACVGAAARAGLETLVLDQTRPDVALPVARVVVPGLRHFWRRLAPGRLYDVPVKLGWLARPLAEDELNPISCFV